jgi:hypothetical protein
MFLISDFIGHKQDPGGTTRSWNDEQAVCVDMVV